MATDINKLHQVALGKLRGRGVGKTHLKCHDVAAMVEFDEDMIIVLLSSYNDLNYVYPMLDEVLIEHDIHIEKLSKPQHRLYLENGSHIQFISEGNLPQALAGYTDCPIIYMRHND